MKRIRLAFFIFLLAGCSNLSKNNVQEGTLYIKNGTYSDKVWKDKLVFDRYSWYHELTLQFDLMLVNVAPKSPFNYWFSKDELESMNKCQDSRVLMAYSLDTKDVPYSSLYEQLEKSGYTRFELLEFKKHVLHHPDAQAQGLKLYHIFGICKKSSETKPLIINIPGYSEKVLN